MARPKIETSGKTRRWAAFALGAGALLLLTASATGNAAASASAPPSHDVRGPVLVELFTSQGCSSCPPADRLLARLGAEMGRELVPLAFHVDFWNSLGWNDPFSKGAWTARQTAYVGRLGVMHVTPQAIVGGRVEVVGADEAKLRAAISEVASRSTARLRLELEPETSSVGVRTEITLTVPQDGRKLELLLAVFETGLVTAVARGENGGRELKNEYVVRSLTRAARISARTLVPIVDSRTLPLDEPWRRGALGVAAILQDAETLEILGARAERLPPGASG